MKREPPLCAKHEKNAHRYYIFLCFNACAHLNIRKIHSRKETPTLAAREIRPTAAGPPTSSARVTEAGQCFLRQWGDLCFHFFMVISAVGAAFFLFDVVVCEEIV